jgi:hypothetical protein
MIISHQTSLAKIEGYMLVKIVNRPPTCLYFILFNPRRERWTVLRWEVSSCVTDQNLVVTRWLGHV